MTLLGNCGRATPLRSGGFFLQAIKQRRRAHWFFFCLAISMLAVENSLFGSLTARFQCNAHGMLTEATKKQQQHVIYRKKNYCPATRKNKMQKRKTVPKQSQTFRHDHVKKEGKITIYSSWQIEGCLPLRALDEIHCSHLNCIAKLLLEAKFVPKLLF